METRSDLELVVSSKSDDEKISSEAKFALWNRYQYFIKKKYFQWLTTFTREDVEFDDFMQEAFIAFLHAIELCDVERMKEKNVSNFSTVLYFQLMKLKNKYDTQFHKYGHVYSYSEISGGVESLDPEDRFRGMNTIAGQWISATMVDSDYEQKKYMYQNLVQEYMSSLDTIDEKICQLLIERKKISNIIEVLSPDFSESEIRSKVVKIKSDLKSFIEMNSYV